MLWYFRYLYIRVCAHTCARVCLQLRVRCVTSRYALHYLQLVNLCVLTTYTYTGAGSNRYKLVEFYRLSGKAYCLSHQYM